MPYIASQKDVNVYQKAFVSMWWVYGIWKRLYKYRRGYSNENSQWVKRNLHRRRTQNKKEKARRKALEGRKKTLGMFLGVLI